MTPTLEQKLNRFFEEFRKTLQRQSCRWKYDEAEMVQALQELEAFEKTLRHAVSLATDYEINGSTTKHQTHYLNCPKCIVRKMLALREDPLETEN